MPGGQQGNAGPGRGDRHEQTEGDEGPERSLDADASDSDHSILAGEYNPISDGERLAERGIGKRDLRRSPCGKGWGIDGHEDGIEVDQWLEIGFGEERSQGDE